MRVIKFRAQRLDNKQWAYGHYTQGTENNHYITNPDGGVWEVDPNTVGQFTGLLDKDGKEIHEDDILKCSYFKGALGENMGFMEVDAEITGVVTVNELSLMLSNIVGEKWQEYTGHEAGEGETKIMYLHDVYEGSQDAEMSIEIMGNIYENPGLTAL